MQGGLGSQDEQPEDAPSGPAAALVTYLQRRGVDLFDREAVQRAVDELNALPFEERAAILPVPAVDEPDPEPAPPVVLPPEDELAALAGATPLLTRLRTVAAFYGDGRRVTATGNPTLADARELARLLDSPDREWADSARRAARLRHVLAAVRLARAARVVKLARGVQSSTRRGREMGNDPLSTWQAALTAVLETGPSLLSAGVAEYRAQWEDDLDRDGEGILVGLYRVGGELPVGLLVGALGEAVREAFDPLARADLVGLRVGLVIEQLLDGLVLAGALERVQATVETDDGDLEEAEVARLTGLGRWFTRELLLARGEPAPLAGELSGLGALELLDAVAGFPVEPAEEEIRRWIARRGPAGATAELAQAVHAVTPQERAEVAGMLTHLPDDAADAVRALRADDLLRPYATLWLVDRDLEPPTALDPAGRPKQLVETVAALLLVADPAEIVAQLVADAPDRQAVLDLPETVRRVDSPHTDTVLQALATADDPALAKAARRAAFKRRT